MIFNHTPLSAVTDLKSFLNITKSRQRLFDAAGETLPCEPHAVNALAARLHPDEVRLTVAARSTLADDLIRLDFKSASGGALPFFRAGQTVCIVLQQNGASFSQPYPLASAPERALCGEWSITVSKHCPSPVTDYLFGVNPGDTVISHAPEGFMFYVPLRDEKRIIFFADETGIGAALSMAECGECDISVYVHGDIPLPGGFHRLESVAQAIGALPASVFICGTGDFYGKIRHEAEKVVKEKKHIRFQITDGAGSFAGGESLKCHVIRGFEQHDIECSSGETLLYSLEKAGIPAKSRCRSGECGYCRCKLVSGSVRADFRPESDSRRAADIKHGVIHPCRSFPETDITLEF